MFGGENARLVRIQFLTRQHLLPGISLCVRMAEQADNRHERRLRFQRHIETGVPSGTDHHIATGEEIGGEQNIPLLQQLLVNQPVKGLAIFKLIDAHHHRFRERVILSGIGVERFARGKVQMQRINFLIKNGVEGRLCSLRDALGESASAQAKRKQGQQTGGFSQTYT